MLFKVPEIDQESVNKQDISAFHNDVFCPCLTSSGKADYKSRQIPLLHSTHIAGHDPVQKLLVIHCEL